MSTPTIYKKWRNFSQSERLSIPIEKLGINKRDIIKIRKIEDGRERLIRAAKLQYEIYGNINSYLTVWIAGYLSDHTIRDKFGSTGNLLELFYNTKINNKKIKQSWADIKRKIKIPNEISEELAEETGIHIGDGNLYIYQDKRGFCSYRYSITGNLINEYLYHTEYIQELLKKLYNYHGFVSEREKRNSIDTILKSRVVVEFKNKILRLPIGHKYNIRIPEEIMDNKELTKRCIVGIIDTDFTLNENINIVGSLTSIRVIKQMDLILNSFKIKHSVLFEKNIGKIRISKEGSIRIIEEFVLKNQKHISKYELWKEFRATAPFSTTEERLAVLKGRLNLEDLERICSKRRLGQYLKLRPHGFNPYKS